MRTVVARHSRGTCGSACRLGWVSPRHGCWPACSPIHGVPHSSPESAELLVGHAESLWFDEFQIVIERWQTLADADGAHGAQERAHAGRDAHVSVVGEHVFVDGRGRRIRCGRGVRSVGQHRRRPGHFEFRSRHAVGRGSRTVGPSHGRPASVRDSLGASDRPGRHARRCPHGACASGGVRCCRRCHRSRPPVTVVHRWGP